MGDSCHLTFGLLLFHVREDTYFRRCVVSQMGVRTGPEGVAHFRSSLTFSPSILAVAIMYSSQASY